MILRVKESGKPVAEVALELDISPNTLYGWISKFGKHVGNGFPRVSGLGLVLGEPLLNLCKIERNQKVEYIA